MIKNNALVPEEGVGQKYINNKMDAKMDSMKGTSIRNSKGQPTGLNSIGKGWGGESPIPKPAIKPISTKVKPMKFKMNNKGIISKKKQYNG